MPDPVVPHTPMKRVSRWTLTSLMLLAGGWSSPGLAQASSTTLAWSPMEGSTVAVPGSLRLVGSGVEGLAIAAADPALGERLEADLLGQVRLPLARQLRVARRAVVEHILAADAVGRYRPRRAVAREAFRRGAVHARCDVAAVCIGQARRELGADGLKGREKRVALRDVLSSTTTRYT